VFENKTNPMISSEQNSSEQQSPGVQDTLSESSLLPSKLLSQTHETDANYSHGVTPLKSDLPALLLSRSKAINSGA